MPHKPPEEPSGGDFAIMEAQLIPATVAQVYHLDLVPGHLVDLDPKITLRPRYGMRMIISRPSLIGSTNSRSRR